MSAAYTIDVDHDRSYMRIVMTGLYTVRDLQAFTHERESRRDLLPAGPYVVLTDMRTLPIQPQDVISLFGEYMRRAPERGQRVAFVVPRSLLRQQVERAITGRDARCFGDIESAERWLFDTLAAAA